MIRGLFLLLVLLVGLATAVLFQGRMYHLRQVLSDRLPEWTTVIAADAGLRRGRTTLPSDGRWPETDLTWTARAPTKAGWAWNVILSGDGVALQGQALLAWRADTAFFSGFTGTVDLAKLTDIPLPVQGILQVEDLTGAVVNIWSQTDVFGEMKGRVAALRIEDQDFGSGPLTATLKVGGSWRADLTLTGGVSPVSADMTGQLDTPMAQLDVNFADGPALPATLRAMLSAAGRPVGQGWQLSVAVPVP